MIPSGVPRNQNSSTGEPEAEPISLTPNPSPKISIIVGSAKTTFWFEISEEGRKAVLETIIVTLLIFCSTWNTSVAQDDVAKDDEPKKKPDVEMLECNVKVIDPEGHPVEGAVVLNSGLRARGGGPHVLMFWLREMRVKTDGNGIAKMAYPKLIDEGQTTGTATWTVKHPDFVYHREDHSVDDDPAEITLQRGFRIALSAKRASSGEKIKENLHVVASYVGGRDWELKKNGMLVSGTMKKQDGVIRVVCFEPGKPTLFSDEFEVKPGDKGRVLLKDIELKPGCRVEGKLADSVKRPVENGQVSVWIVKKLSETDLRARWIWRDKAKIQLDGTFVFESLPPDEVVQMIPICDGWVPAKPKPDEVLALMPNIENPNFVAKRIEQFDATPQLIRTEGEMVSKILQMVKVPMLTIEVTDDTGTPVEGVKLGSPANQFWFNAGSQILGKSSSTRNGLEAIQRGDDLMAAFRWKKTRYRQETGKDGTVVFKSTPQGTHDFSVFKKGWEIKDDPETGEKGSTRVTIGGEDQKVTIKMYPQKTAESETGKGEVNDSEK